MGKTTLKEALNAEVGIAAANTGGKHGGISPSGGGEVPGADAHGSSGNPGTEFPWDGADATQIGANTSLPPLKSL